MPRRKKGGAVSIVNDLLKIELANGQSVNTSPGALVYMRGDIQKGQVNLGSIGSAFARSFGSQDFFLTKYSGGPNGGTVAFSLSFPGDIVQIVLKPNESYRISKGCFLACSDNVVVSATTQIKGIIGVGQDEGVILPLVTNKGDVDGVVWLGGFGSFERHDLRDASDTLVVDNGIFLACPNTMSYKLVQLGRSLWSSLAGGEGFGMEFRGPGVVYTQSKNFNEFLAFTARQPSTGVAQSAVNAVQKNVGEGIGNAISSWMTDGGKKRRGQRKANEV